MNQLCIRHNQVVISFCSNSMCNDFLKMYCSQCDTSNCIDYHMKVIEEQQQFINSIKLPEIDFKLWDGAKMQFSNLKSSISSLQQQIVKQLDDSGKVILNYISEKIAQIREEILAQFNSQLENCGSEFEEIYETNVKQLEQLLQLAKSTFSRNSTEKEYCRVDFKQITTLEQKIMAYEADLYLILEDNSKQLNQINGQLNILQENPFEKSSSIVFSHIDSALSVILCKFYQLSGDSRTTSLAESEILNKMMRRSRSSIVSSQLGQSIVDEQLINDCSVTQIVQKECQYSRSIVPLCLVSIRDSNQILTAGESSDVFLWEFKEYWEVQCTLSIKDLTCIQAMELVYNPIDNRTSTRASFASLRVLLNPVIALAGSQGIYLIQADSIRNELVMLAKYPTKETTICLQSLQQLGYYNYFMAASDTGVISIYQYIISIEEQFTLRLDQVVKCHQDAITSLDIISDQFVAIASSDRSVSIWQFVGIKMKPFNRLNRFWEDIPCLRTSGNTFITFDRAFNIVQWEIQDQQVRVLNQCQSKAKLELHEVIVFNECFVALAKDNKDCYLIVLDKQFKMINSLKINQHSSLLCNPKKKKQFYTNHKMRVTQQYEFAVINNLKTTTHFAYFKVNL